MRFSRDTYLVIFGAAVLALSIIVYVIAHGVGFDLLATVGIIGALAILVVALPTNDKNNKNAA